MLDKLIEARKRWNQLSDCIYEIGAGDLDNSRFSVIYQNFEDAVLESYSIAYPEHKEFLTTYFCAIVLDVAEAGFSTCMTESGVSFCIRNEDDLEELLMYCSNFEYIERN